MYTVTARFEDIRDDRELLEALIALASVVNRRGPSPTSVLETLAGCDVPPPISRDGHPEGTLEVKLK